MLRFFIPQRGFTPKPGATDSSVSEMRATPGLPRPTQIPTLLHSHSITQGGGLARLKLARRDPGLRN
jgi:hypothetical protein